jgi:hypothetical protein
MKVGRVLPHLGTEATKDSIVRMTLSAENEALIRYGLQKDFSGRLTRRHPILQQQTGVYQLFIKEYLIRYKHLPLWLVRQKRYR